ncbi:MAG TPA: 3'-5' exonuclease [Verrucomicrobiae bacterium]|nr:3'-5' exonuclease [Verrucomicrobiae bacterium]
MQVIRVANERAQAQAAIAEVSRLLQLGASDWSPIAVLSSTHRELADVRALAEAGGIPIRWVAHRDKMPTLHQIRELGRFLLRLEPARNQMKRATQLTAVAVQMFGHDSTNSWVRFLFRLLDTWQQESGDAELPVYEAMEFLYEMCAESRREFNYGAGVTLSTVHAAKGTEYEHVLVVGAWPAHQDQARLEESRRALYVGMTRARRTLAVFERQDIRPALPNALSGPAVMIRQFAHTSLNAPNRLNYETLGFEDIHLGFPGTFSPGAAIHAALARLEPGDNLMPGRLENDAIGLFAGDVCVARLSHKAEAEWASRIAAIREVRVLAIARRTAEQDTDQERRERYQATEWEIPIVELVVAEA